MLPANQVACIVGRNRKERKTWVLYMAGRSKRPPQYRYDPIYFKRAKREQRRRARGE